MRRDVWVLLAIVLLSFIISITALTLLGLREWIMPFLGLSLSDSINPCTFVIYSMLLIALSVKEVSKAEIYRVGLAFVMAIFISYYALGVGLVVFSKSIPTWVAGALAIAFGVYTMVTGYLERSRIAGKGSVRRKIFSKDATLVGAFTLGVIVSFTLLPCSAGSYLIYAILISKVGSLTYLLLALYNMIFVLPLIVILFVMGGISESKSISQRLVQRSRELSMLAGAALVGVGLWVLYAY